MRRHAFTMMELIFVIVVIGIIGVVGTNVLKVVYENYIDTSLNNRLQAETEIPMQQIANRLQYRIKNSVIARKSNGDFSGLTSADGNETILEWVGYDIDGWLGTWSSTQGMNAPTWSGFIDLDTTSASPTNLSSPQSDLRNNGEADTVIKALRASGSSTTINNSAIFFVGAPSDVRHDYGWDGTTITDQAHTAHPITAASTTGSITPKGSTTFANVNVFEQYKLAWTAYALSIEDADSDGDDDLVLYYDYQPWEGESYTDGDSQIVMTNVDTFSFQGVGDMIKLQLCINIAMDVKNDGGYVLCKEKAVF
jgi:prepilin-type N-terminal cleavage/methylation domain-containing protein